ncbi:NADH:ubiquinone oxidoreductase [Vibrio mimicus]|uniref:NADH:ubiquinone oxidoreductase n=1 Tax=Vibrio mimicus TaxID=674 RepID=UPI000878348F|nr:NADH:ubiquinone oxidoreductase [Vibrio mimicus]AOW84552.1 NADH:ubiquinone oxidoreductase [Vibrio mimicus]
MKLFLILMLSVSGGIASVEHIHSFILGFGVASLAVGSCYWLAFRSTRFPQLAVFLLLCGFFAKVTVTVVGVMWGISNELMTSPFVFALSYLFFSIVATYFWFRYRELAMKLKAKITATHTQSHSH